jgi:SlyX protein
MDERVAELEIKLSYAEDLLEELNHTVFRQQEQIDLLIRQVDQLASQLRELEPEQRRDLREELPPHY